MTQGALGRQRGGRQGRNQEPVKVKPVDPEVLRKQMLRPIPAVGLRTILIIAATLTILWWGLQGTETSIPRLVEGLPAIGNFVSRLTPPEFEWARGSARDFVLPAAPWSAADTVTVTIGYPRVLDAILETIQMAIIGTMGAVLLSIPISLFAARNISPHPLIFSATRFVLNVLRAIPELIYGLIFVAAVGLGPFPGVLALVFGSVGSLSRIFAEAIEQIDPQQVAALRATGAGSTQTFLYGVLPQALPLMVSYSLIYFESNVRNATILGIVGAGGVGFDINRYISLFQYRRLMGTVILLVIAVTVIDRFSNEVRRRLI